MSPLRSIPACSPAHRGYHALLLLVCAVFHINPLSWPARAAATSSPTERAQPSPAERIQLWPGPPPGEFKPQGPERKVEGRPRPFYQLTGITQPVLEFFPHPSTSDLAAAVLVCPGGGLQRLAYEHEGLEVAARLNAMGVTAFVLKYRVPAPAQTALMDAQRAMKLIRKNATRWKIDPASVGIMGFSAGGEIAAWLMTHSDSTTYSRQDEVDDLSSRPDFSALIYPGGLLKSGGGLKDSLASKIRPGIAPNFIAHAFDDASDNSLEWALALKKARVPAELHLYQEGTHGFGVRDSDQPTAGWFEAFMRWLQPQGHLDSRTMRTLAQSLAQSPTAGKPAPTFKSVYPDGSMDLAYQVQRRVVRTAETSRSIAGFKGAGATAAAQKSLGVDGPLTGVLFQDGWLKAGDTAHSIHRSESDPFVIETELGFVMGTDFSFEILHENQARDVVSQILPVIELPKAPSPNQPRPSALDMVAANVGSARFITGRPFSNTTTDPGNISISIAKDGRTLHEVQGGVARGGQWRNLMEILNSLVRQGHTLRAGQIVLCGALGTIHPGEPGVYEARYGATNMVRFEIR